MINRLKKLILGSIKRELLLINIFSFTIVIVGTFIAIEILIMHSNSIDKALSDSNGVYVEVSRYVTKKDEKSKKYLQKVAKNYDINVAITDLKGNVILKSEEVYTNNIDLIYIQKKLEGSYESGEFYQTYDVYIDNERHKLIVWKLPGDYLSYKKQVLIFISVVSPIAVILLIYFLTRKKTNYIRNICIGIKKISHGDLEYKIEKKGFDELSVLADEINNMSINLKNRIEAEKAAENLKRELVTNVSHDLRTPLTSIIGFLQLLESDKISKEDKQKYIKTSIEKADKLKGLIDDLFEYSKLESGGIKLEKKTVNIVEIIEQCIGEVAILAREKDICFKKQYEIVNLQLKVDPYKISRVFENILSNAIKYSLRGSSVYINILESNDNIIISFENITNDLLNDHTERIFDRFYKVDKSRNSQVDGSGLGLAISRSIVDLHGGEIWAKTKGNKFKIYVKLKKY